MEDIDKLFQRMLQSLGDRTLVSFKHVENEIDTVEPGGIGVQINHYHGVQPQPNSTVEQALAKAEQVRERFSAGCSAPDGMDSGVRKRSDVQPCDASLPEAAQPVQTDPERTDKAPGAEPADDDSEFVVPSHIPSVLNTDKAWELWKRAKANGWVDRCLQPTLTDYQATILANVMAGLLELKVRWSPFEQFWGIKKMASKWVLSQGTNYYSDLYHEIKTRLSS